jgi:nucleoside-diphosphate-sugar epimerase
MSSSDITLGLEVIVRVFVTGASGWIGSAVVPELRTAGYQVVGLARSDAAAARVHTLGAGVRRGDLADVDGLRAAAAAADGVVHLGYNHDFSRIEAAAHTDHAAITAIGTALEGTGRPFVIAAGTLGVAPGQVATEEDVPDPARHPRIAGVEAGLAFAARGVRPAAVRFAPTVHGPGDHGFVATLARIARDRGISGYVDDGAARWPAVHRLDAAPLFRLALERAPAGSVLHGVADEGVPVRAIAEVIGRHLDLPVVAIAPKDAGKHFGWLAGFLAADVPASSALTREQMGWQPTHPGLIDDLDQGHYFHNPSA